MEGKRVQSLPKLHVRVERVKEVVSVGVLFFLDERHGRWTEVLNFTGGRGGALAVLKLHDSHYFIFYF